MGEGQTFLSEETKISLGDKRHLMIVVAEKDGEYLIVPVTTWHDELPSGIQDDSCILNKGDHSFIKHKSWLDFRFSKSVLAIDVLQGLLKGFLIRKEDLKPDLLKYIQGKTEISDRLPAKFKHFFEKVSDE